MIKTILAQVREYRLSTVLAPLFTVGEVVLEVLIPFVTASIIDKGIQAGNIQQVYLYGGLMLLVALLSLVCGVLAGRFAAKASSGLACNLRESICYSPSAVHCQKLRLHHGAGAGPHCGAWLPQPAAGGTGQILSAVYRQRYWGIGSFHFRQDKRRCLQKVLTSTPAPVQSTLAS